MNNGVKGLTGYDEEKVSPSGGLLFKATDKLSLYANYMEGLSQGKIAPSTSVNEDEIFPPFISRQVEVGAKYDAGAYALTAAVFRIKQPAYETNATTRVFGPNGKRENQGVELSLFGEPLSGLRLLGGATWTEAELRLRLAEGSALAKGWGVDSGLLTARLAGPLLAPKPLPKFARLALPMAFTPL